MLNGAKGQSCVNCGARDQTVVAAHYQGIRAGEFGKGTGKKPDDLFIADLCQKCHRAFDSYEGSSYENRQYRRIDNSEQFLTNIMRTILRRIDQGIIEVK
jgi:hypothetical protein